MGAKPRIRAGLGWLAPVGLMLLLLGGLTGATATDRDRPPGPRSAALLVKSTLGAGGRPAAAGLVLANGTLGQSTPIGIGQGSLHRLSAGFWAGPLGPVSDVPPAVRAALFQNYPNPFNPMTTIRYVVAEAGPVEAAVFDARGRRLRTLVRGVQEAGPHEIVWDGKDDHGRQLATGLYFYRLRAGDFSAVRKMMLIK